MFDTMLDIELFSMKFLVKNGKYVLIRLNDLLVDYYLYVLLFFFNILAYRLGTCAFEGY